MNLLQLFKSFLSKFTNRLRTTEATGQELEAFFAQQEREYREAEREQEDSAREEQERRDAEWEEEQRHYQSHCAFCGSKLRLGRCKSCDDAFGRN